MDKQQYAAIASSKLLHAKPILDDTNLNKTLNREKQQCESKSAGFIISQLILQWLTLFSKIGIKF